jgi:hypothetical protein
MEESDLDNLNESQSRIWVLKKLLCEINQKTSAVIAIGLAGHLIDWMNFSTK